MPTSSLSSPLNRHPRTDTHTQPACAHCEQKHNPLLPCPSLPPSRHRPIRTSPGSRPSDMKRPWRGALLFPSRGWRGACFPPLPFRTQTGMYLGQPGRGWTCQGPAVEGRWGGRGGDDSIFQVFCFSEIRPVQLLTSFAPSES